MKPTSVLALLILSFLATGCSTMKVTSERDNDYDFSTLDTYQWINGPTEILNEEDTYINEDIKKALSTELTKRGLQQVMEVKGADVQVAYYVKLKEEQEYTSPSNQDEPDFSGGFVYRRESSSWSYEEREPDLTVYAVEIGTLTVLVYDAATGDRIWRGNLQTKIDRSLPEDRQQERIQAAAEKLMYHLPVGTN
jgi:hypothetical protein